MEYYAQVIADRRWDEVSEQVYADLLIMINLDGTPRYNGNRFCKDEKGIQLFCVDPLSPTELAILTRMCNADKLCPPCMQGGFVQHPEFLFRKKRNAKQPELIYVKTGEVFKKGKS